MDISGVKDSVWREIVLGTADPGFESLALNMLVMRVRVSCRMDSSPEALLKAISEFREWFVKNDGLPSVQRDAEKLLNR